MAMWKLNCRPRKILLCRYLAKVRWLRIHPPMLSDQACTPRKAGHFAPVLWGVGRDRSEGLNRIQATAWPSYHFPSFHAYPEGIPARFVWIRRWSSHQRAFYATTASSWFTDLLGIWRWGSLKGVLALKRAVKFCTFLCSWHRIRGFRPPKRMETSWKRNTCSSARPGRCSSGNPPWQHRPEVFCGKWLNLEVTVGFAVPASKCSQISSAQNDRSQGANVYHFQSEWPNVARHDCSVWFASPLRAIFQRLAVKRFQAQPHANWTCFRWWWCEKWALTRNLTQSMDLDAKFDGHGHGSVFSIPVPAVQLFPSNETPVFVEGWYRNIGAEGIPPNQASNGLGSFGIHLQWERFESAKARTGSPFGTAVQIQKGANEDHTLKSLEFVSQSLYLKDARREIKRLLVKRSTMRVSTCVRHSCMHLQRALRLSVWSGCENGQTSFAWSKISRSSLRDAGT